MRETLAIVLVCTAAVTTAAVPTYLHFRGKTQPELTPLSEPAARLMPEAEPAAKADRLDRPHSVLTERIPPPTPPSEPTPPPEATPPEPAARLDTPATDICKKDGGYKVVHGRGWRCRYPQHRR